MKVVLFCGGLGVRMGDATQAIPKPMIPIGNRPIVWHIMRYYASFGHTEFILCLGYRAEVVKQYFLDYREALTNDFVLEDGGRNVELLDRDIAGWRITFVDTGTRATIGERLKAVEPHLGDDDAFLATYGDGLTDAPLDHMIATFHETGSSALFLSVPPTFSMHIVQAGPAGRVTAIDDVRDTDLRINGGFFVLGRDVVEDLHPGEELVVEPFRRLIGRGALNAYAYDGFWQPMDTLKDRQALEELWESGDAPWRPEALATRRAADGVAR